MDRDGAYGIANRAYEDRFGRPTHEVEGRATREVVGDAADDAVRSYVERAP